MYYIICHTPLLNEFFFNDKKVLIFFRFFRVPMIKYNKINRKESILWKK